MKFNKHKLDLKDTQHFSKIVLDYVINHDALASYVTNFPSKDAIGFQMLEKARNPINREMLVSILQKQYENVSISSSVQENILRLNSPNTFTICTAHQPNIFTGYLYFIYKIIHAIKLSQECKELFPNSDFVPVYYMGSEDNDLDEIGTINWGGEKLKWQTSQVGACGRMKTSDLLDIRNQLINTLNEKIEGEAIMIQFLKNAYDGEKTLAEATRFFVNELFSKYGLVVIDGDDASLKASFKEILIDELLENTSERVVSQSIQNFEKVYKSQANPRAINLFYLIGNTRERIEKVGDIWQVLNTDISFNQEKLLLEVEHFPERFSPNVILRPLYQEMILPNIAFVGGGGELAYWLPLSSFFKHYQIPFPVLFLRNSILLVDSKTAEKIRKLGLTWKQFFQLEDILAKEKIKDSKELESLQIQLDLISDSMVKIKELSGGFSNTLPKSMEAHASKMKRIQDRIFKKFEAHLKRNEADFLNQIQNIKFKLSSDNSLQERHDNFLTHFKHYGFDLISELFEAQEGFGNQFLILEEV